MKSCVTVSLVPEAKGGPFVFWDDFRAACQSAGELGFDAVELFAPGPEAISSIEISECLAQSNLSLAAVGTGAGWVRHRLTLTDEDPAVRTKAIQFVRSMIDFGAQFNAPTIIGSMQGRAATAEGRGDCLKRLAEALAELGEYAARQQQRLIYEPLNRYETNLCNTLANGCQLLDEVRQPAVCLLADLFHMNIEEVNLAESLRNAGSQVGHVHFVDSNRRAAGFGHLSFSPIITTLHEIGYEGFLSAEALSWPNPLAAARQTIDMFHQTR